MITAPTTIDVSSQNWNGKSCTSRSVNGSNRYDPAGKKISWKMLNSWSKASSPTTPRTIVPTVRPSAPARTARHVRARSRRRLAAMSTHDGNGGQEPQAAEDGPDVGHVRLLTLLQDGRAIDLDREVTAEHEVGQDRRRSPSAAARS